MKKEYTCLDISAVMFEKNDIIVTSSISGNETGTDAEVGYEELLNIFNH